MNDLHRFGKIQDERRRQLRENLRVIQGGKSKEAINLDRTQLDGDPFLREHYLGTPKRAAEVPLNEQLKFFLFGLRELPPEAG